MSNGTRWTEEHNVTGKQLVATLKRIIHEGNVRRVVIKNASGRTVLDIPLAAGVVGAALLPLWAAVGALAAGLVARYTLVVERVDDSAKPPAVM